ncbi:MAG TPA: urease accessory protein UreD [Dermatophilaceae bacterium]|nr:urease accessory protein UreD [Dermatophilaceae bacterium]
MRTATETRSVTELAVRPGRDHPRLRVRSGQLAPRLLRAGPGFADVALVTTTATLLGGDDVELRVILGEGVRLELVDVAATVAYDGRGRPALWTVSVAVAAGASLVWRGEPLVVAQGADVRRRLRLDVAAGGRALLRDAVVLGRHGESGGDLRCETTVSYAGSPLLVEQLDLTRAARGRPGVLGPHRLVETLTWAGDPVPSPPVPEGPTTCRLDLSGPGLVVRHLGHLGADAHASPLGPTWAGLAELAAVSGG